MADKKSRRLRPDSIRSQKSETTSTSTASVAQKRPIEEPSVARKRRKEETSASGASGASASVATPSRATSSRASTSSRQTLPVPTPNTVFEEPEVSQVSEVSEVSPKTRGISREQLAEQFDVLLNMIQAEVDATQKEPKRDLPIRNLKNIVRELKKLKTVSVKSMKKPKVPRKTPSGFMKPRKISTEMANFAGWDVNELKTRTDVTRTLCAYIRENNLQDPNNKKRIIPDSKLKKLLRYNEEEEPPLTYYYIQKKYGHHFEV